MAQSHRPDARGVPPTAEVVELRVPGVGGAPPEDILDVPSTALVAGDESAGFFRPSLADGSTDRAREAYSWGGLTSASRLRALWVLLAPFAVANLAGWMLRHDGEPTDTEPRSPGPLERLGIAAIRIFGLVLTVALASYLTLGAADLVGFQCGGHPSCTAGRWWLAPFGLLGGDPNRAVGLGVVVAAGAILGIAELARRSQIALHEETRVDFAATDDPTFRANLTHAALWESPQVAHRLGLTHTAAALGAVALTVAIPAAASGDLGAWAPLPGWALLALGALLLGRMDGVASSVHIGLLALSSIYLVWVTVGIWRGGGLAGIGGRLPGADTVIVVLFPVWALVTLTVVVTTFLLWRRGRHGSVRAAMTAPGLLAVAVGMVSAFGSGLLVRLADLIGRAVPASDYTEEGAALRPDIAFPDWVGDISVVTVLALVVFGSAAAVAWLRAGPGRDCSELAVRYADRGGLECDEESDRRWAEQVGRAEAVATVTDRAATVLGATTAVVLAALAVAVAVSDDPAGLGLGPWSDPLIGPASVVLGLVPVVAVVAIARLYRSRAVRRVVGVLWDVAVFWPRWFHPWSPPSYGERAVPQLGGRVSALSEAGGVVMSAHSQGSVLAVATLSLQAPSVWERTALLTHGSPLTRLYARFFPEYFSSDLYSALSTEIRGWINLWRATDFIGGVIDAAGVDDREVLDPPSSRPVMAGEPRPLPLRHSDYERTEEYAAAASELAQRVGST